MVQKSTRIYTSRAIEACVLRPRGPDTSKTLTIGSRRRLSQGPGVYAVELPSQANAERLFFMLPLVPPNTREGLSVAQLTVVDDFDTLDYCILPRQCFTYRCWPACSGPRRRCPG